LPHLLPIGNRRSVILLQIPNNLTVSCGAGAGTSSAHPTGMSEQAEELKKRTFQFAVRIVKLVRALPATFEGRRVGGQLFDAGTSVAANYRAFPNRRLPVNAAIVN
jgi:hypothetical protein